MYTMLNLQYRVLRRTTPPTDSALLTTHKTHRSTTVARTKSEGGEKKPSQMGMVRTALQEMGGDPKPLEMQAFIKSKFGQELPANIISNYKSQIKRKNGVGGQGRGRRPGLQVEDIETIRKLVKRLGTEQVKRIADVVG